MANIRTFTLVFMQVHNIIKTDFIAFVEIIERTKMCKEFNNYCFIGYNNMSVGIGEKGEENTIQD